jgi:hypothetical protein
MSSDGTITIVMGSTQGSADVHVYGCGCVGECCSRELYNYGGKTTTEKSAGFPKGLSSGNYTMTYSWSIASITCCSGNPQTCTTDPGSSYGPISLGTFPMTNLKLFKKVLMEAFDAAVASVTEPGCSQKVSYSSVTDNSFTVTYTVTCTSTGCTGGATTVSFTIEKQ